MTGLTHYMGICDWCKVVVTFPSEQARQEWRDTHPCEGRE